MIAQGYITKGVVFGINIDLLLEQVSIQSQTTTSEFNLFTNTPHTLNIVFHQQK